MNINYVILIFMISTANVSASEAGKIDPVDICYTMGSIAYDAAMSKKNGVPINQFLMQKKSKEFEPLIRSSYASKHSPRKTKIIVIGNCINSDMFEKINRM